MTTNPTIIFTHDGPVLATHPEIGTISRRTREDAEAEIRRRKLERTAA